MKSFNTLEDVKEYVESENRDYTYYENYTELEKWAEEYAESYESNSDEPKPENLCLENVKKEKYFCEESNTTVEVVFYEAYTDPTIPKEDYFFGYFINE